jgi:hypothetical protein
MARTTVTAVQEILQTALSPTQVQAFIEDASLWVTEMLAPQTPTPTASRLEIIERYLTCAIIRLRELMGSVLRSTTIGDVTEDYEIPGEVRDYLTTAAGFDASGLVRKHFLAPRPVAAPVIPTYGLQTRFGNLFKDELPKDSGA